MPQLLSTPFDPGEIDPGASYTHFQVLTMLVDFGTHRSLTFEGAFGVVTGDAFVEGKAERIRFTVRDKPRAETTEYTDMVVSNLAAYQAIKAALYDYAEQHLSRIAGALV